MIRPVDWIKQILVIFWSILLTVIGIHFYLNSNSMGLTEYIGLIIIGIISLLIILSKSGVFRYVYILFLFGFSLGVILGILTNLNLLKFVLLFGIALGIAHFLITILIMREFHHIEKNREKNADKEHTAIIVVFYCNPIQLFTIIGVKRLVMGYTNFCSGRISGLYDKESYRIYPVYCKKDIIPIINDSNCKRIWIFSHGLKHGISLDEENLYYCEFENAPKKDFIAQLHCNCSGGKSLIDYLIDNPSPEKYIVSDTLRGLFDNLKDINRYLKEI